ncbi:Spherulin-4 [Dactylella cylindrospora]|nr:Spherulin-4 [Dactylella cylindrospora]
MSTSQDQIAKSSRESAHVARHPVEQSSQTIEHDLHRHVFSPYRNWYPEIVGPQSLNSKDNSYIQSSAISGENWVKLEDDLRMDGDWQACKSCKWRRRFIYSLISGVTILLLTYLSVPISKSVFGHRTQNEYDALALAGQPSDLKLSSSLPQKRASSSSFQANIIYPAYFGPEETDLWSDLFAIIENYQTTLGFTIILNPYNGPGGTDEIARYSSTVNTLGGYSNVRVLGYVHQSWGRRSIQSDINTWIKYFPKQLDGFFLDEMPSIASNSNLSTVLNNNAFIYKKSKSNFRNSATPFIVQNPGTEVGAAFYKLKYAADVTIVVENAVGYLSTWVKLSRPSASISAAKLGIIMVSVSNAALASTVQTVLSYANYIFVSDLDASQAYQTVSSNFDSMVSYAYTYRGVTKKTSSTQSTSTKISVASILATYRNGKSKSGSRRRGLGKTLQSEE